MRFLALFQIWCGVSFCGISRDRLFARSRQAADRAGSLIRTGYSVSGRAGAPALLPRMFRRVFPNFATSRLPIRPIRRHRPRVAGRSGIGPKQTYTDCLSNVSGFFALPPGGIWQERQLPTLSRPSRLSRRVYGFRNAQLKGTPHRDRLFLSSDDHGLAIMTGC